jgi:hypothetical protein
MSSIVPSGHSASTCHSSPSLRTTQKMGFRDIMLIMHGHVGPAPPNRLHSWELSYAREIDLPQMREELEHALSGDAIAIGD